MLSRISSSNYFSRGVSNINLNRNIHQGCARLRKSSEKSKGGLLSRIKNVINISDNELSERRPLSQRTLWMRYSMACNLKNVKATPMMTSNVEKHRYDSLFIVNKRNYCDSRHISKPPIKEPNTPEKSDKKDNNSEKKKVKKPVIYVKNDTILPQTNLHEKGNQKAKERKRKKIEKPVIFFKDDKIQPLTNLPDKSYQKAKERERKKIEKPMIFVKDDKIQPQINQPEKNNQKAEESERKKLEKPMISVKDDKIQPHTNIAETSTEKDEESKIKKVEKLAIHVKNDSIQPKSDQKQSSGIAQVNRNKWGVKLDKTDPKNQVNKSPKVTTENEVDKPALGEEKIFYPTKLNKPRSVMATLVSEEVENVSDTVVERPKRSRKFNGNERIFQVNRHDLSENESEVVFADDSDHVNELAAWKEAIQKSTGRENNGKLVIPARLEDVDTVFIRPEPPKRD